MPRALLPNEPLITGESPTAALGTGRAFLPSYRVKGICLLVFVALLSRLDVLLMRAATLSAASTLIAIASILIATTSTLIAAASVLIVIVIATAMRRFAALLADFRHMLTILADGFAAFTPRLTRFLRVKLMSASALMRGFAALAGDFALLLIIHRSESAFVRSTLISLIGCHLQIPFVLASSKMQDASRISKEAICMLDFRL